MWHLIVSIPDLCTLTYLVHDEKTVFVDKSRVKPTIFFVEKILFSLKLFSGHFYGQSFIKIVRGPLVNQQSFFKQKHYCITVHYRTVCASENLLGQTGQQI